MPVNILGCNERWYMPEGAGLDVSKGIYVRTVLVGGDIGDYAAYQGIGSQEYVALHGDKVSFAEACVHFPNGLEEARYRK